MPAYPNNDNDFTNSFAETYSLIAAAVHPTLVVLAPLFVYVMRGLLHVAAAVCAEHARLVFGAVIPVHILGEA